MREITNILFNLTKHIKEIYEELYTLDLLNKKETYDFKKKLIDLKNMIEIENKFYSRLSDEDLAIIETDCDFFLKDLDDGRSFIDNESIIGDRIMERIIAEGIRRYVDTNYKRIIIKGVGTIPSVEYTAEDNISDMESYSYYETLGLTTDDVDKMGLSIAGMKKMEIENFLLDYFLVNLIDIIKKSNINQKYIIDLAYRFSFANISFEQMCLKEKFNINYDFSSINGLLELHKDNDLIKESCYDYFIERIFLLVEYLSEIDHYSEEWELLILKVQSFFNQIPEDTKDEFKQTIILSFPYDQFKNRKISNRIKSILELDSKQLIKK